MKTTLEWQDEIGEIKTRHIKAIQDDAYNQAIKDASNAIHHCGLTIGVASFFREMVYALRIKK